MAAGARGVDFDPKHVVMVPLPSGNRFLDRAGRRRTTLPVFGQASCQGGRDKSVDWLRAEMAAYYRELQQVRALIREAEESSARGESGPLDLDEFFARADKVLDQEGVPE